MLRRRSWRIVALTLLTFAGAGCTGSPQILSDLDLRMNPSGRAPLAGSLSFVTDQPARATLVISDGEHRTTVTPSDEYVIEHELMVLGLRPARAHTIEVFVENRSSRRSKPAVVQVETPSLPEGLPPVVVSLSMPSKMEPGLTLIPFFRWPATDPDPDYGLVIGIDHRGEILWYYQAQHRIDEPRRLRNGNLLYLSGRAGNLVEIDMLGNTVVEWHSTGVPKEVSERSIGVDTDTFHHDVLELPWGNLLVLSTEVRHFDSYPTSERREDADPAAVSGEAEAQMRPADVIGDVLVEFRRDGKKVREWKFFDLLDPYRLGYGSLSTGFYSKVYKDVLEKPGFDWTHGNAIFYDTDSDAVLVSMNFMSSLLKLDLASGQIRWILGDHQGWNEPWRDLLLEPQGELLWSYHQHAVELTPKGTVLLYDNGTGRAMPPDPPMEAEDSFSRAVEYRVDDANRRVSQVWSYGGPGDGKFFAPFISEADWLPQTGNVLVTSGGRVRAADGSASASPAGGHHWVTLVEVTHTTPAEKVWEVVIDDPELGWAVYRSERVASLYP